tara:strand:- start:14295 stop:14510 length:216 start_codon:yes stop_codon:yes gene_type:complete
MLTAGSLLLLLFAVLPIYIAYVRRHRNRLAILVTAVISMVLSWLFLPLALLWLVALVWSCTSNVDRAAPPA